MPWLWLSNRGRSPRRGCSSPTPISSATSTERAPSASALVEFLFGWRQNAKPHGLRPWASSAVLSSTHPISVDSHLLEFRLEEPRMMRRSRGNKSLPPLLLPGQHLMLAPHKDAAASGDDGTTPIREARPYTPINVSDDGLRVTLLVKRSGPFSRWLVGLAPGQSVAMRGPFGAIALDLGLDGSGEGCGGSPHPALYLSRVGIALPIRRLALIAGGSGVTPVAQMLNAMCASLESRGRANAGSPAPPPLEVWVLVSDHTPEHALLSSELDDLAHRHPQLIVALHRTFTSLLHGQTSPGGAGARRIDEAMLRERLPPPANDTAVLVCGPPGFEASAQRYLASIGHLHTVNLSSGDVSSPAVSQVLLTAHRLLTPWAAALRCFVPAIDSSRSMDSEDGGSDKAPVKDKDRTTTSTPLAAARTPPPVTPPPVTPPPRAALIEESELLC